MTARVIESIQRAQGRFGFQVPAAWMSALLEVAAAWPEELSREFEWFTGEKTLRVRFADPDLFAVLGSRGESYLCLHAPPHRGALCDRIYWVDGETNRMVALGGSVVGAVRFLVGEAEYRSVRLGRDGSTRSRGGALAAAVRQLLSRSDAARTGLDKLVDTAAFREPHFGYPDYSGVIGVPPLMPESVPYYLNKQAEDQWMQGNLDQALATWETSRLADPRFGATQWSLGVANSVGGCPEAAASAFAQVLEGSWLLNRVGATVGQPWCWGADAFAAARWLRTNLRHYERASRSPAILRLVANERLRSPDAWLAAMRESVQNGREHDAAHIAMSGMDFDAWHGGEGSSECASTLLGVYKRLGVGERAAHLER